MQAARVTLQGSVSYRARGKKFLKGKGLVVTDPGDIAYFKGNSAFVVSMIEVEKEKAAPAKAKAKAPAKGKAASAKE